MYCRGQVAEQFPGIPVGRFLKMAFQPRLSLSTRFITDGLIAVTALYVR